LGGEDEDCLNLDGMLSYSQQPNSDSVGFQSLGWGAVPANCMLRKTGHCWNLAGTLLESHRNIAGTLLEPRWENIAGTLLEHCWHFAGTPGKPVKPCWNLAGKSLKSCSNLAGALRELCWNLAGTW